MAGNRKNIMDIRQVLQLKQKGYSNRKVAFYLRISRNTVNGYVKFFNGLDQKITAGSYRLRRAPIA